MGLIILWTCSIQDPLPTKYMLKVYTKIDGKTATFVVETNDPAVARLTVQQELGAKHKNVILALVEREQEKLVA